MMIFFFFFPSAFLTDVYMKKQRVGCICVCAAYLGVYESAGADGCKTYTRWCLHNTGSKKYVCLRMC